MSVCLLIYLTTLIMLDGANGTFVRFLNNLPNKLREAITTSWGRVKRVFDVELFNFSDKKLSWASRDDDSGFHSPVVFSKTEPGERDEYSQDHEKFYHGLLESFRQKRNNNKDNDNYDSIHRRTNIEEIQLNTQNISNNIDAGLINHQLNIEDKTNNDKLQATKTKYKCKKMKTLESTDRKSVPKKNPPPTFKLKPSRGVVELPVFALPKSRYEYRWRTGQVPVSETYFSGLPWQPRLPEKEFPNDHIRKYNKDYYDRVRFIL